MWGEEDNKNRIIIQYSIYSNKWHIIIANDPDFTFDIESCPFCKINLKPKYCCKDMGDIVSKGYYKNGLLSIGTRGYDFGIKYCPFCGERQQLEEEEYEQ